MIEKRKKIGMSDSGVGGLTVVRELVKLLPDEDIVYYGDNKNCPYGNRTADDIERIARGIIGFLMQKEIKAMVIACNTTSALVGRFAGDYPFPVFDIISPAAGHVAESGLREVGVVATELTIRTGTYARLIHERDPQIEVLGEASHDLARLVDRGDFNLEEITAEVRLHLERLERRRPLRHIIYGCTHYPIVSEVFEDLAPQVEYIDPAVEQARAVAAWLKERGLCNDAPAHSFDIYSSGDERVYRAVLDRLHVDREARFHPLL